MWRVPFPQWRLRDPPAGAPLLAPVRGLRRARPRVPCKGGAAGAVGVAHPHALEDARRLAVARVHRAHARRGGRAAAAADRRRRAGRPAPGRAARGRRQPDRRRRGRRRSPAVACAAAAPTCRAPVADNYAGTALLLLVAAALVGGRPDPPPGGARRPRTNLRAQAAAVHDYVILQQPKFAPGIALADPLRLEEDLYRTCVPGPDPQRWLCLYVNTVAEPRRGDARPRPHAELEPARAWRLPVDAVRARERPVHVLRGQRRRARR